MVTVTGHRGCAALELENSLRAINRAIELGVDAVEIDIMKTKDGELVLMHDEDIERVSEGKGKVSEFSLAELKKIKLKNGEEIPTLEECIQAVRGRIGLKVEIKQIGTSEFICGKLMELGFSDFVISSFFHTELKQLKEKHHEIKTGIIFSCTPADIVSFAKNAKADYIIPKFRYITNEAVREAKENNLIVDVWNIDDKESLDNAMDMDVDGICTNNPELILKFLGRQ